MMKVASTKFPSWESVATEFVKSVSETDAAKEMKWSLIFIILFAASDDGCVGGGGEITHRVP